MKLYKIVRSDMKPIAYNVIYGIYPVEFKVGKTFKIAEDLRSHKLCSPGVFHAFSHKIQLLINGIYYCEHTPNYKIFEAEGEIVTEDLEKCGVWEIKLTKELPKINLCNAYNDIMSIVEVKEIKTAHSLYIVWDERLARFRYKHEEYYDYIEKILLYSKNTPEYIQTFLKES